MPTYYRLLAACASLALGCTAISGGDDLRIKNTSDDGGAGGIGGGGAGGSGAMGGAYAMAGAYSETILPWLAVPCDDPNDEAVRLRVHFTCRDDAGRPPPYYFSARVGADAPLLQVFRIGPERFARVGMQVRVLEVDTAYVVEISNRPGRASAQLYRADEAVVLLDGESVVANDECAGPVVIEGVRGSDQFAIHGIHWLRSP